MELKEALWVSAFCWLIGFNRTFMELKEDPLQDLVCDDGFQSHLYGIERENAFKSEFMQSVSIAPLWN